VPRFTSSNWTEDRMESSDLASRFAFSEPQPRTRSLCNSFQFRDYSLPALSFTSHNAVCGPRAKERRLSAFVDLPVSST
jgi:hypothetical protein